MQWSMNNTYHEAIYIEPYKALTENKPRCGLAIKLPANFLAHITTGVTEELIQLMNKTTEDVQDAGVPTDELPMPQCNTPSHKMFLPLKMCQIYQQQQISWSRKMLLPQKFLLQMMMLPQKRFIPWMFQIQKILPPLKMHQLLRYPSLKNPLLLQLTLQRRPPPPLKLPTLKKLLIHSMLKYMPKTQMSLNIQQSLQAGSKIQHNKTSCEYGGILWLWRECCCTSITV